MRLGAVVTAVVVGLLLSAATASAERQKLADYYDSGSWWAGDFALAGDEVVYTDELSDGWLHAFTARPGGGANHLRRIGPIPEEDEGPDVSAIFDVVLRASPEALAILVAEGGAIKADPYYRYVRLGAGAADRLWIEFGDYCVGEVPDLRRFALDGTRLAYPNVCSFTDENRVVVRDTRTGAILRDVPVDGWVDDVQLAGRYLSYTRVTRAGETRTEHIVVRDLDTGGEVYRVPVGQAYDLQADGKVVRATGESFDCRRVEWFSPDDPSRAHPVGGCALGPPQMAGDRIAFLMRDGRTGVAAIAGLDGTVRRVVSPVEAVDFDGERLATLSRSCTQAESLWMEDLAAAEDVQSTACPARIGASALRYRRMATRISCPRGCHGYVEVRAATGKRRVLAESKSFTIPPGATKRVRITPRDRRPLLGRGRRSRSVVIGALIEDRNGDWSETRRRVRLVRR